MKKISFFIYISLLSLTSYPQEVFDLKKCIELGLNRNYDIQIVKNEQIITDNNKTIGNAGYLPQVDFNMGYGGTLNNIEQHLNSGKTNKLNGVHNQNINAGVNLNWTIFDGFNIQANYSKLKELQQQGELNTRLTIENFIANLSTEYYNHIQQKIRLNNLRYALKLSQERLRIVEARYQIGSSSKLELQQAKVDFNADSSRLIKQQEIVYSSQIELTKLLALDNIEQEFVARDTIIEYNSLINKAQIWDKALSSNTLILLSEKEKNISKLELKSAKSLNYPYLKLNAGYGYTQNMYETGAYNRQQNLGFNYGVTLGLNLFDGKNKRRKQKNAQIQILNKELEYENLQLSVKAELSNMWMAYSNNMQLAKLENENLQTARDNYAIAIERYKLGDLSGIELREAQNSLLAAEERLIQAQYNTKLCEISLMQISGQILSYLE